MSPFETDYSVHFDARLLQGCCREAERADIVASNLEGLRASLAELFHAHMTALVEEVRAAARILRDLADLSHVFIDRVPLVLGHLNIILPCLQRTLRDVTAHYEDRCISREMRWRKMYNCMRDEVGGLPLPQRLVVYNTFLTVLRHLLTRSQQFDLDALETLRMRILQLREARGIQPPSSQVGPLLRPETLNMMRPICRDPSVHWAEQIFTLPLSSRTTLKHVESSTSWGPHSPWDQQLDTILKESKMLFKRPFDNDRLSVVVYLNLTTQVPHILIRTIHMGAPWFALRGAHELCISREGSSLQLKRWSRSERCSKLWASLFFKTWEEMVLFHSCFVSLKARNAMTVEMNPGEFKLASERRLFQAQILDDGFKHSLIVYGDVKTKGIRLHAAVWDGELQRCPVWTAFVTHQCASPTWLHRESRHRVWLRDVQPYVFCQRYRPQSQRQEGSFEICFVSREAAARFREVFSSASSVAAGAGTAVIGEGVGGGAGGPVKGKTLTRATVEETTDVG